MESPPPEKALWVEKAGHPVPVGTVCSQCKGRSFPFARLCRLCGSTQVTPLQLARLGVIETFAPSANTMVAEIRLSDGMLVMGEVGPKDKAAVGARVEFKPSDHMRFEIHD